MKLLNAVLDLVAEDMEGDISKQADLMNLYSRQIGAFGIELMGKLMNMKVLIVGVKGIGVETAKNLILAGPKAVHIHDNEAVKIEDLGTNFYLSTSDVGKNRAESVIEQLASLNPYVEVKVHHGALDEHTWNNYHALVYTDNSSLEHLIQANDFCHNSSPPKVFVYACNHGMTSAIFSDFGPSHVITDPNGEPTKSNVVEKISPEGIVTVATDRHGMDDGDYVKFEEVLGMTQLNDHDTPIRIKRVYRKEKGRSILSANQFQLDVDVSSFGAYLGGGIVQQVNVPKTVSYKPLRSSVVSPICEGDWALYHMDMNKLLVNNTSAHLHFAKLALWEFQKLHNDLPGLHNYEHAAEVVQLAKKLLQKHKTLPSGEALVVEEIDEEVVRKYSLYARAENTAFSAFVGGVVAQEVVKYPGKFTPLRQWLHHDSLELVSSTVPQDAASRNCRYDWQINLFGYSIQEKIFKQKWFLVGAGALGCEYIKGMALMGLGAKGGTVHLTDMDRIEVSNLNRQFLFRRENVNHPKSVCAAKAAMKMNPDMHILTYEIPVGPDTEEHFDDRFWSSLDGVWNALDNVKARQYTDSKCVFFEKPLLESGTLGTKANSEIILPHKTQCYSDHKEAQEDSIPMCTLRNFPHFIEHCIEWARAQFSELFSDDVQDLNSLLRDKESYFDQVSKEGSAQLQKLESMKELYLLYENGITFETCVELALKQFTKQYRNRILDLTHAFPEDARKVDKDTGVDLGAFWSGEKRFPQAVVIDIGNELHLEYIYNAANLFAFNFGVSQSRDKNLVAKIASAFIPKIPDWKPKAGLTINLDENDGKEQNTADVDESDKIVKLKDLFRSEDFSKLALPSAAEFEKDDDLNYHIDFITAASNLRAWNYRIKETTRHKCKMIAGKIIPALATTTAMITGLVEIELYKYINGLPVEKFANTNVNLAVNQFQSFEPLEPNKAKVEMDPIMFSEVRPVPVGFSVWDKVVVQRGDLTVEQFCQALSEIHHGVTVSTLYKFGITQKMIDEGRGQPLYNSNPYLPQSLKAKQQANYKANLKQLYLDLYGPLPSKHSKFLILDGEFKDKDDEDAKIPKIVYYF
jgi:ubiquitin-activating enzyme E1